MDKQCVDCGSLYKLECSSLNWRDKDSIDCEICGSTLHKWNEAKTWDAKLIKRGGRSGDEEKN